MTGLEALPAEILLLIVESVREKGICPEIIPEPDRARADQALTTLYNICLVSRCFRELGQRVLYQEFSFSYDGYIDVTQNRWPTWWRERLASFIKTLVARPDLAALVKRAFIHPHLLASMKEDMELEASTKQVERALGIPQCRKQDLCTRLHYLIFGLMPNLEHMVLQPYCSGHRHLQANPLEWMAPSLPVWEFPRLRSLELSHDEKSSYIPLQFPYKQWPISTLTLRTLPSRFSRKYLAALGEIPTIVNLRILDSHLDTKEMRTLVGAATITELRSFTYVANKTYYCDCDIASACDTILALRRCEKTLRHLHIDTRQVYHFQKDFKRVMLNKKRISSLKQFTELETFVISAESLCDYSGPALEHRTLYAELLPPSLKSLRVTGAPRLWPLEMKTIEALSDTAFLGLAKAISDGGFPNLKEIRCAPSPEYTVLKHEEDAMRQLFAESDVDFCTFDDAKVHTLRQYWVRIGGHVFSDPFEPPFWSEV